MKKEFKFKPDHSNIENLYNYAVYKFPNHRKNIEYDEVGRFVYYKKNGKVGIFYYVNGSGHLCYNVYWNQEIEINKPIIKNFKDNVYTEKRLIAIFDKILKPVSR